MSYLTHRYKYAISDAGTPIFIDDITQENRRDTAYTCAGCGRQLFPVLAEKRERHFRHEKDSECSDYNRYLHEYAKAVEAIGAKPLELDPQAQHKEGKKGISKSHIAWFRMEGPSLKG